MLKEMELPVTMPEKLARVLSWVFALGVLFILLYAMGFLLILVCQLVVSMW